MSGIPGRLMVAVAVLAAMAGGSTRAAKPAPAAPVAVTVFAAASLTNALGDIATLWEAAGHPKPRLVFASSSTLAQQIGQGAPAQIFISADERWMDDLAKRHAIVAATRRDLLSNTLVLVEPRAGMKPVVLKRGADLAGVLAGGGRLAVGETASVPAGIYARQALEKLGLWDSVKARLAPADSVRAALRLVETGAAPAGIVYGTDVGASPGLAVAGVFPADSHDPIRYPAALVRDDAQSRALLVFLDGQQARDVFAHYGFGKP